MNKLLSLKDSSLQQNSSPQANTVSTNIAKNRFRDQIVRGAKAYGASLLITGVIVPVVASLIAVGLYLTLQYSPLSLLGLPPNSRWYTLVYSSLLTGIVWFVATFALGYFCTAQGANPHNYSLLRSRLRQLNAYLGLKDCADSADVISEFEAAMKVAGFDQSDKHKWNALKEAYTCCIDVGRKLCKGSVGLTWIIGTGYNSAWTLLHHAEEVLIEVTDVETVVRGAKHDFLSIQSSQIDGRDELLEDLVQAVAVLQPEALDYFKEHQPGAGTLALRQLIQVIDKYKDQSGTSPCGNRSSTSGADPLIARAKAAREALREVRSTLNDFRDKRWEELVRQRSQLLATMVVTGVFTHVLLCILILANVPPAVGHQALTPTQSGILAATMFYLVGALAGLVGRFVNEAQGSTAVDDFGLSKFRLVATPLLSGLAGIAGVFITVVLAAMGGSALTGSASGQSITLANLFPLDPRLLFVAAIFGVTPNLVIKSLQEKANQYQSALRSSTAADGVAPAAKV